MPHDKNGNLLKAGDLVSITCVITSVCEGEYCTLNAETVEVMPGNGMKSLLGALNAKQVVLLESAPVGEPAVSEPAAAPAEPATAT